jgi:predicted PurR-regulated permease PerM
MILRHHFELTFGALKRWFIAQCYDAVIVGLLWLAALWYLHVPLWIFWAVLGALLQFIPNFGPALALLGPTLALLFSRAEWERFVGLLIAYAVIALADGLLLQPYLMRRQNRVPVWASLLAPLVLGVIIPFWGVFLAPPLLAVIYAYVRRKQTREAAILSGQAVILPPEQPVGPRHGQTAPVVDSEPQYDSRQSPFHELPIPTSGTRRCRSGNPGGGHRNR